MDLEPCTIPEQRPLLSGDGVFPLVLKPTHAVHDDQRIAESLAGWCGRNSSYFRGLLLRHGAVVLRDCGVSTAEDFSLVSRALGCEGYDYVGGAAPRTEIVPGVVFTSNESPPDQPIPFHHELAQSPFPPNYIMFFCEREAAAGGATPIVPSEEIAAFMSKNFPAFSERLESLGVRYIRVMPLETDPTSAQGRSWKETYAVASREEAEAAMRKQGTSWEWLDNGDCRTITTVLPAVRKDDRTGRQVFFNSMVAAFTGWNDSRNVGEKAVVLGDGTPVDADAIRKIVRFMAESEVAFPWKQGDVLVIDNTKVMHSRQTFTPPRRVLASLRGPPFQAFAANSSKKQTTSGQKPLRFGILGTGAMGKEHIRNIALLGEDVASVVAIADNNAHARKEALEELGRERGSACAVFHQASDLINCDFVDALIICSPNFKHIEHLRMAIPTGKHILCEKPLCTTIEDCVEVEDLLAKRGANWQRTDMKPGIFMTGMEYRWMPPIRKLVEETDRRSLDQPLMLSIREHRFPFLVKVDNWNRFNSFTGGTLVEKACHFFDLMRRVMGSDPVRIYASGDQAINHKEEFFEKGVPDIIDNAFVVVDFTNGTRAVLDLCMFAEDEQTELVRVVCKSGSIEARCPEASVRTVRRRHIATPGRLPPRKEDRATPDINHLPVSSELAAAGFHEGATFFELQEFCSAANGQCPVPVTARDGRMAVSMGAAAQASIALGRAVHLSADGRIVEGGDVAVTDDRRRSRL